MADHGKLTLDGEDFLIEVPHTEGLHGHPRDSHSVLNSKTILNPVFTSVLLQPTSSFSHQLAFWFVFSNKILQFKMVSPFITLTQSNFLFFYRLYDIIGIV